MPDRAFARGYVYVDPRPEDPSETHPRHEFARVVRTARDDGRITHACRPHLWRSGKAQANGGNQLYRRVEREGRVGYARGRGSDFPHVRPAGFGPAALRLMLRPAGRPGAGVRGRRPKAPRIASGGTGTSARARHGPAQPERRNDMNGDPPAFPRAGSARPRPRRMDVRAALLATAVLAFAASAEAESLQEAAWAGDVAAVTRMLATGADPGARIEYGWTPLHEAAKRGLVAFVRLLLDAGADPDVRYEKNQEPPLHWAAEESHVEVVRLLLDRGAGVRAGALNAALHAAIFQAEVLRLLLDKGADLEARDNRGVTPLDWAETMDQDEVAALLRERPGGTRAPRSARVPPAAPPMPRGSRLTPEEGGYPWDERPGAGKEERAHDGGGPLVGGWKRAHRGASG